MLQKLEAIKKAYSDGNYMAALALSLTIPDICGQVEFPEINYKTFGKGYVGERYKKWFDLHLKQYYGEEEIMHTDLAALDNKTKRVFNADICYALRCAVLHSGNDDVARANSAYNFMIYATNIDIEVPISITGLSLSSHSTEEYRQVIVLDLYQFCNWISIEAEKSYNQNKNAFKKHMLPINYITIDTIDDIPNALKLLLNNGGKEKLGLSEEDYISFNGD